MVALAACHHTWTGWDGSVWDLSHGTSGLKLLAGTRGMRMPALLHYTGKAPAVAGSLWRAVVTDERDVFWPLKVEDPSDWITKQRAFWKTMRPDQLGRWTIVQPWTGEARWLDLRFYGLADDADDFDPGLRRSAVYGLNLKAEAPFWSGAVIPKTFTANSDNQNFYGGASGGGFGPPFYISSGLTVSTATITNPGDVEAWPVWTVHGPTTSVTVGVNGRTITFPMTLAAGQWVRIDTRPTDQTAVDQDGLDRTRELAGAQWAEIPAGVDVPLQIVMAGSGSVDLELTPQYYQAV